jgi:predicted ArsR family transcriptional regulator
MERSRERILRIIQQSGSANVETLSRRLGLAPATVRRHLDILQRDGLVTYSEVRKQTGRPEYSFSLTERGHEVMPKGYDALLLELIREIGLKKSGDLDGKNGRDVLREVFQALGERAGAEHLAKAGHDAVSALAAGLEERDFGPDVSRLPEGVRVKLTNCPFRAVARADQAVCAFDSNLISRVLGKQVRRESCIAEGDQCCMYVATRTGGTVLETSRK